MVNVRTYINKQFNHCIKLPQSHRSSLSSYITSNTAQYHLIKKMVVVANILL